MSIEISNNSNILEADKAYIIGDFYISLREDGSLSINASINRAKNNLTIMPKTDNACLVKAIKSTDLYYEKK